MSDVTHIRIPDDMKERINALRERPEFRRLTFNALVRIVVDAGLDALEKKED